MTTAHSTPLHAETIVQIWERGRQEHAVDRALTMLAGLSGLPRHELAALSVERRDVLLFSWRARIFGPALVAYAGCPRCPDGLEVSVAPTGLGSTHDETVTLELGGHVSSLRMPTSVDLAAIAGCESVELARRSLIERCVVAGADTDEALAAVEAEMGRRARASALCVELACPSCGQTWSLHLDIGSFMWREMELLAGQLLQDVDVLARRYGWSEQEILGLSGARRGFYLELAS